GGPPPAGPPPSTQRRPLYQPGLVLHHQVALRLPDRLEVLIGRMRFDGPERYRLYATSPFGLDLFELGYGPQGASARVADPLKGAFPAEALAEEIAWIYLRACPADVTPIHEAGALLLRCGALTERLDPKTGVILGRTLITPTRRIDITYTDHRRFGDLWLAGEVRMISGAYEVQVHLDHVDREEIDGGGDGS
ncbi:DUF3261 domain-containing protein, partial [Myxococcota bacterium]|nr:DUF3261 domain-containing protein [Myxococcota bacterium]